jgi:hypothetical protein
LSSDGGIVPCYGATRGRIRARIEHAFANQKHRFGLIVRTVGCNRAKTKIANLA